MMIIPFCAECGHVFVNGEVLFHSVKKIRWLRLYETCYICQKCSERENMPNIKITAEVDGKQVPLNTISTESFEAIKALEKSKEIPVARLAKHYGDPLRLLIKPTRSIDLRIGRVYAIDLQNGALVAEWELARDDHAIDRTYSDVKPL